jgi:hypothetical protein
MSIIAFTDLLADDLQAPAARQYVTAIPEQVPGWPVSSRSS